MAYSMKDYVVTIAGQQITGFIDGNNAIEVKWNKPLDDMQVGADGVTSVYSHVDHSGMVILRLMWESNSNQYLGLLAKAQQKVQRAVDTTVSIQNVRNGFNLTCNYAVIGSRANIQLGNDFTDREWEFKVADMVITEGVGATPIDQNALQKVSNIVTSGVGLLGTVGALGGSILGAGRSLFG